jgi:acetolactate synthase-1/2/3 large subunit
VKITVADALLKQLEHIGVDTVFGIISIHNIPFYDALERHGGFRIVAGRHEGAVVNMADAYSRVSGKLGVALTSTGTGAGNAAGAIIESWNGGAPLLHVTGQVASSYVETGRCSSRKTARTSACDFWPGDYSGDDGADRTGERRNTDRFSGEPH